MFIIFNKERLSIAVLFLKITVLNQQFFLPLVPGGAEQESSGWFGHLWAKDIQVPGCFSPEEETGRVPGCPGRWKRTRGDIFTYCAPALLISESVCVCWKQGFDCEANVPWDCCWNGKCGTNPLRIVCMWSFSSVAFSLCCCHWNLLN